MLTSPSKEAHISQSARGFTLIELLVVIAIVAVLAVTVILSLNPAQLLKQARDSNRLQDLAAMKSAISLYLTDVKNPNIGSSSSCYVHGGTGIVALSDACADAPWNRFIGAGFWNVSTSLAVDKTGWLPVNLNSISSGSPFSVLPQDPAKNNTYFYAYQPDSTNLTFEINAKLESLKYSNGGSSDKESTDGGNSNTLYEVGTAPGLAL